MSNVNEILNETSEHGCDHNCEIITPHEICTDHTNIYFQDEYDEYVAEVSEIINNSEIILEERVSDALKRSITLMDKFRFGLQDLEFYRKKFTPMIPLDVETSNLKKCKIGRCSCGQLLVESKHQCCPKCMQFIDWKNA